MAKYYRLGDEETPYLLPGSAEGAALQASTYGVSNKYYFVLFCRVCHTGLCRILEIGSTPGRAENVIAVEPCPNCLKAARDGGQPEALPWPRKLVGALDS